MKQLTLLQEALNEEKALKLVKLGAMAVPLNIIEVLLPNYKPQYKQALFHNSKAYEKGIKGGYGSGKTFAFCVESVFLSYVNRPLMILLSCTTDDVSELTTIATLKELLDGNDVEYDYVKDDGHFTIYFGNDEKDHGNIYVTGQGFMKGPNAAAVGFDEPFSQRKATHDNLIARVRHPKAKRLEVFWSGTAEPDKMEWGFEYFKKDWDDEQLFTTTIATTENIYAPKEYVETLKRKYDKLMQQVYLEGQYVMLSANRVYHAFHYEPNTKAAILHNYTSQRSEIILSFDFNVDPMTAVVVIFDRSKTIPVAYQLKEFVISSSNTKELCTAVIGWFENSDIGKFITPGQSIIITGDASGRRRGTRSTLSDYEIIRDEFMSAKILFYFNVPQENPPVRDRMNYVNNLFEKELFYIDTACTKSINDRERVTWKSTGDGFIVDKSKKDLTHLSDAADYALWNNQILMQDEQLEQMCYFEKRSR